MERWILVGSLGCYLWLGALGAQAAPAEEPATPTSWATRFEVQFYTPSGVNAPIVNPTPDQSFLRPYFRLVEVLDPHVFPNTPRGAIGKFMALTQDYSGELWNLITFANQKEIVDTMVDTWLQSHPEAKVNRKLVEATIRSLFEKNDSQVAQSFWRAYINISFKFPHRLPDLSGVPESSTKDHLVVGVAGRQFYLQREEGIWKIDIIKSEPRPQP